MCTKFRFSRSRSKRYYRNFGESRKKVNLSESDSRDWVDQVVWNLDTCKINILTQCVPNFVQIFLGVVQSATNLGLHTVKSTAQRFFLEVGIKFEAAISNIATLVSGLDLPISRKKVNLSESDSRDWVDQVVWNLDTCKINILTQCVPNFVQIGLPGHTKKYVFLGVIRSATIATLAKVEKRSIFRKAILEIESTKLSEIWTPVRSIS